MALAAASAQAQRDAVPSVVLWRPRSALISIGWLTLAQASSGAALFVASMTRARYLTLSDFGLYALATTIVSFTLIIADFGLSVIMVRDLSRAETDPRRYLASAFVLACALAMVAGGAVVATGALFSTSPQFAQLTRALAIGVAIGGLSLPANAYLRAQGRTWFEAIGRLLGGLTVIALTALIVVMGGGLAAFGWAVVASSVVMVAFPLGATFASLGVIAPRMDRAHWRRMAIDTAPLGLAMMFTAVYFYADSLMLAAFGQREALGRYNACYVFVTGVVLAIASVRTGFMPGQSRGHAGEIPLAPVLKSYVRLSIMLAVPLAVIGPVAAPALLRVMYGSSFVPATWALRVLLVTGGVMFASSYCGSNMLVSGRQSRYLVATITGAVVNVALNIVLIPLYSLTGAAIATLIAEVAVAVFLAVETRTLPNPRLAPMLVGPLIASVAGAGLLFVVLRATDLA